MVVKKLDRHQFISCDMREYLEIIKLAINYNDC